MAKYRSKKIVISELDDLWVEVRIYKKFSKMMKKWKGTPPDKDTAAWWLCELKNLVHRGDKIGTLYFCEKHLYPEIIAHEAYHAVMDYIRILDIHVHKYDLYSDKQEEFIARCIQIITYHIHRKKGWKK